MPATWSQFREGAPALAGFGKERLEGRIAYLATTRPDGSPRVHPVSPVITDAHLFVYMEPTSPKARDLRRDSRYAMHCAVEDNSGGQGEFFVRGQAVEIVDPAIREEAFEHARSTGYCPLDRYALFHLNVIEAMATAYEDDQPKRLRWKSD